MRAGFGGIRAPAWPHTQSTWRQSLQTCGGKYPGVQESGAEYEASRAASRLRPSAQTQQSAPVCSRLRAASPADRDAARRWSAAQSSQGPSGHAAQTSQPGPGHSAAPPREAEPKGRGAVSGCPASACASIARVASTKAVCARR